mmetsp:Transcript_22710/g.37579  ORF Transcript_22710/g.37579 Transcript_22710/m.37579 type:complete len:375 (-) Transcript_22710:23-1147(-)|eukprot:CAMPEP_0119007760 /NCGR_PEP_ID=MMETSP1176-20130426/3229_1 /TAXON_ID=265551 /ORGANISM="Synedropsis recta cf, Strain CCMP1620" /LENGTH=374 /DNA_ID=CAMNT_0006959965 /DNA_START=39 /DNA_END=1163 /DNA_ORIENTATION=+
MTIEEDESSSLKRPAEDNGAVSQVEYVAAGMTDDSKPLSLSPEPSSVEARETRPNYDRLQATSNTSTLHFIKTRITDFRLLCGAIINNDKVQLAIVLMIAINALMMGIGTFSFVTENEATNSAFELIDKIFLIIFTIELSFQLIFHGFKLFLDGWLIFDFIIIVVSWSFSSLQIIRAFRIFRALRLVTRIAVMKNLVLAVFSVMPRLAAINLLLLLIFYIFAVMFTQLFKNLKEDGHTEEDYFSRLDRTLFTLFQIMTLDAWGDIAREVILVYNWAWLPFVVFVTISGFIVVNLIIAVICDAVSSLHLDVKAKMHGDFDAGEEYSEGTLDAPVRDQVECIEEQVDELQRRQEQTMHTLDYLCKHLQALNNDGSR